jgi:hypothetical protein
MLFGQRRFGTDAIINRAGGERRIPNPKEAALLSKTLGQLQPHIASCDHSVAIKADLMQ